MDKCIRVRPPCVDQLTYHCLGFTTSSKFANKEVKFDPSNTYDLYASNELLIRVWITSTNFQSFPFISNFQPTISFARVSKNIRFDFEGAKILPTLMTIANKSAVAYDKPWVRLYSTGNTIHAGVLLDLWQTLHFQSNRISRRIGMSFDTSNPLIIAPQSSGTVIIRGRRTRKRWKSFLA